MISRNDFHSIPINPLELVLSKLPDAKEAGGKWTACCPAHEDSRASLSICRGNDGKVLLHCFAGCEYPAICDGIGLEVTDLFPRASALATATQPHETRGKLELCRQAPAKLKGPVFPTSEAAVASLVNRHGPVARSWMYYDRDGEPVGIILRWNLPEGKKDILPVSRHPDGWRCGGMPDPRPLYRLPELADAELIFVTEGEKAADAAASIGLVATTSAHGSQSPGKTDWGPLAGKNVVIMPDNDEAGRKYAETVAGILMSLDPPAVVKVIDLPDLPDKGDIFDWIEARDAAEPEGLKGLVLKMVEATEPLARDTEPSPAVTPSLPKFEPFPVDCLPDPLDIFVRAGSKAIGCDPSFLALPVLSVCGAAIGNTSRVMLKVGWLAGPVIWTAVIGESGSAKTPAFRAVMQPVRDRQHAALTRHAAVEREHGTSMAFYDRNLSAWKKNRQTSDGPPKKPIEPTAERVLVSDTTIEALAPILASNPRGILLAVDELAGWFGSFDKYRSGGGDAANWLSMFNAETLTVDRKTGTPRTLSVRNAAVCVTGGIQPGILRKALGAEHRDSGLAARLLMAYPPRVARQWSNEVIDSKTEASYARLINGLYDLPFVGEDGETRPTVYSLTNDAKSAFIGFYDRHAQEQRELTGDLAAAWSKLEETPGRLALIIHQVRCVSGDSTIEDQRHVDAASMAAAIRLTEWFKHEARRVYAMMSESESDREQRELVGWIARQGGAVTARELQRGPRQFRASADDTEATLDGLVKAGLGVWEPMPTTGKGGWNSRRFRLATATLDPKS